MDYPQKLNVNTPEEITRMRKSDQEGLNHQPEQPGMAPNQVKVTGNHGRVKAAVKSISPTVERNY